MKALFILLMLSMASITLSGQTYYYVTALEVIPENPSTTDEVSVHVIGEFSSTGSYITGHSIYIGLNTIILTINCADDIGATVITPFDTTFVIGTGLLEGDYTIELEGTGLGDFVSDPADYDFTVTGPNALAEELQELLSWTIVGEQLLITNGWDENVQLSIYDIQGRQLCAPLLIVPGTQDLDLLESKGVLLLSFEAHGLVWVGRVLR
jgi:hypothetical protein